jgi:hypothetical protein
LPGVSYCVFFFNDTATTEIYTADPSFKTWDLLSRLDPNEPRANLQANALAAAFARKELATPEDAESAFRAFIATDARLRGTAS